MQAILVINKQTHSIIHCCLKDKTRSCSLSCSFCYAVGEGVGPLQSTYPSLGLNASLSSWKGCAVSRTSTCSDSWWKNKYLYMHTKGKRLNQMRNKKIRCWWLWENGRERQEGESGSRGAAALIERLRAARLTAFSDVTSHANTTKQKVWKVGDRSSRSFVSSIRSQVTGDAGLRVTANSGQKTTRAKERLTVRISPRSGSTSCTAALTFFINFHHFKRKEIVQSCFSVLQ